VLYDRLGTAELLEECRADALRIDVGKAPGRQAMTQQEINSELIEHGRAGRRVVRLKGGDPFVFGRGGEEAEALAGAGIACTMVPGITSAIAGLAAAGIPITHRQVAASFAVVTGHEDPTRTSEGVDWRQLATAVDTVVVLMGVGRIEAITQALIAGGREASTPAALIHAATTPAQRVAEASLADIAAVAKDEGIEAPALLVVGDVVALRDRLALTSGGPLAGKRELVTRTRRQASTLADALRTEGALPLLLPAIEVQRRAEPDAVRVAIEQLRAVRYQWVVFTSDNAVQVMLELMSEAGADARAFAGTRICAVGPATAKALAGRGLLADLMPVEADGDRVLEALVASGIEGATILLPRAEGARSALPEGLRAAGAAVDELTLYLSAAPANPPAAVLERIRAGGVDIVTFTSSSTVRNLATLLDGDLDSLRRAVVACIGPQTAETAKEYGLPPQVVAEEHTVPGLVEALVDYFEEAEG
jgi:uroporphyrinogen III methyltransferase/synthase